MCTATGSFQITGYSASNTYTFTQVVGTRTVCDRYCRNVYFTQTNAAGCTSPASSSIVVNAQPATPAAPTAGTVTQPTCAQQQAVSNHRLYASNNYTFTPSVVSISGTGL
jgi:hypothetical protein